MFGGQTVEKKKSLTPLLPHWGGGGGGGGGFFFLGKIFQDFFWSLLNFMGYTGKVLVHFFSQKPRFDPVSLYIFHLYAYKN